MQQQQSLARMFVRTRGWFSKPICCAPSRKTPLWIRAVSTASAAVPSLGKVDVPVFYDHVTSHDSIQVQWPSGNGVNLPVKWLRDHCHCKDCINQDTMQRAVDVFSSSPTSPEDVRTTNEGLQVRWSSGRNHDHVSHYPWKWLSSHVEETPLKTKRKLWDSSIKQSPPSVHYDEVMADDKGVGKWTSKILEYGFCFVNDCPVSPEKTEKLLERIAFIRTTHYGGFYDFTSDLTMKDTAYTSLALPAHTDTTYFTDPAGLQMFHLLSHTSGTGGASLLVDGFACAAELKRMNPSAYDTLCKVPVRWHASGNDGIVITPARKFPVLNIDPDSADGELMQVRWNNDDRATMPLVPAPGVSYGEWFEATKLWSSIVRDKKNEFWAQMKSGQPLIFDNWRVMHGRSAFTGKRRISGGYINRDDFVSRYWNTNFERQEVLDRIL